MASPDRKGGGGLSLQTLAIASAASVTAALVTSRLFQNGTLFVSALTPVIVAGVSEMLHRPANRAREFREQRRTMVLESRSREMAGVAGEEEAGALRGAPDFAKGGAADEVLGTNGDRAGTYVTPAADSGRRWGRIHPKVAIATGLAAFAIAIALLTLPELIFGGAVANQHRTTFFGGGKSSQAQPETKTETTQEEAAPETVTETAPSTAPAQEAPTATETSPTATETTPTETQPTPTDTGSTPTSPTETVPIP